MKLFLTLRRYARTQHLVMAIALGVLSGLLTTGILFLINEYLFKWGESARDKALLAFLILLPLVALSRYVSSLTLASLGLNTSYDLQIQLTRRILAAPLLKVQNQGAHRMLVALTDDIGALTDIMTNIPSFFINLAVVMGSLVYMGWLSPPMLGVVLGFMIFGMVAYSLPLREGIRRQRLSREIEDDLFEHFRGLTEGVKELKMRWERRKGFLDFMRKTAASYRDMRYATSRFFIGTTALGNFLLFSMLGILLFYMPTVLDSLDTSTVASYLVVLLYMMTPLQIILQDFPMMTRADVAIRKIERLGISLSEDMADEDLKDWDRVNAERWKELRMVDVQHTYHNDEDSEFTLGPVNLAFEPGEIVFIVGGNGSGKTTLAMVLLGLYPPESGDILLDGERIEEERLDEYRQNFSTVFSDFFLFQHLLGLDSPDLDSRVREHLQQLRLEKKVRVEEGRLSTVDLSRGQRKRLALMNSLIDDRLVYVLDEWAADQDPEFKKVYYEQILPALRDMGKLVIVISHDDHYFHTGDRIIKMDYGQVVLDQKVAGSEYAKAG